MPLLDIGTLAPDFSLLDQFGNTRTLRELRGRFVVIFFYPEDDTPLCTRQACQFRDTRTDFSALDTVILGISPQSVQSKLAFDHAHKLGFILLADDSSTPQGPNVSVRYGAWGEKNMYGNIVRGMIRTTYLLNPDGRIAHHWARVKTPGHAQKVLDRVRLAHSQERSTSAPSSRTTKPAARSR